MDMGTAPDADTEDQANNFGGVDSETVSYVISSSYRRQVLDSLMDGPATPAQIAREQPAEIAHISREIGGLRDRDVIDLIVPEGTKKGRLYALTQTGETLMDEAGDVIRRNTGDGDA